MTTSGCPPGLAGITGLTVKPKRLRPLKSGPTVVRSRGAVIRFTAPLAETVRFTLTRAVKGRRVGASCRRESNTNRKMRACTRYVAVTGSFSYAAKAGANTLRFSGRLRSKRLARGRYRLIATPLLLNHVKGTPSMVSIQIV